MSSAVLQSFLNCPGSQSRSCTVRSRGRAQSPPRSSAQSAARKPIVVRVAESRSRKTGLTMTNVFPLYSSACRRTRRSARFRLSSRQGGRSCRWGDGRHRSVPDRKLRPDAPLHAGNGPSFSARCRDSVMAARVTSSIARSHHARPSGESYGRPAMSSASWTPMRPSPIFRVLFVASPILGDGEDIPVNDQIEEPGCHPGSFSSSFHRGRHRACMLRG